VLHVISVPYAPLSIKPLTAPLSSEKANKNLKNDKSEYFLMEPTIGLLSVIMIFIGAVWGNALRNAEDSKIIQHTLKCLLLGWKS
jgi:hypothetical protein